MPYPYEGRYGTASAAHGVFVIAPRSAPAGPSEIAQFPSGANACTDANCPAGTTSRRRRLLAHVNCSGWTTIRELTSTSTTAFSRALSLTYRLKRRDIGVGRLFAAERLHWVHRRGLAGWNVARSYSRRSDERARCSIRKWIKGRKAKQQRSDPA
jgi:hypothetical protein